MVVINALYREDQTEYLPNLKVDGIINGWLVGIGSEEPPIRSSAGFEQVVNVICTPAVGAEGTIDGEETFEYFGTKVFTSVIPRNVRLAEAPSFGKPILVYDVASIGAQADMNVARVLLARVRGDLPGAGVEGGAPSGKAAVTG